MHSACHITGDREREDLSVHHQRVDRRPPFGQQGRTATRQPTKGCVYLPAGLPAKAVEGEEKKENAVDGSARAQDTKRAAQDRTAHFACVVLRRKRSLHSSSLTTTLQRQWPELQKVVLKIRPIFADDDQ